MIKRSSYFVVTLFIFFIFLSFQLIEKNRKKIDKEIKTTFQIEFYELVQIVIPKEENKNLKVNFSGDNFFKINDENKHLGYAFIDKAPSKTAEFDYLVLFDKNLTIKKIKILRYREEYGGEIGSKRWLKQFYGKSKGNQLIYNENIIPISGATISANSMCLAINNLLYSLNILSDKNIL